MRWERDGVCLALQWKDNRPVTMLKSIDNVNDYVQIDRNEKVCNVWQRVRIRHPKAVHHYNQYMNAVDRSDQILAKNSALRKCTQWWKTLFFHMIEIAVVNSFILFQLHRAEDCDVDELKRPNKFSIAEYREELVRQLAGLEEYAQPPVFKPTSVEPGAFETAHIVKSSGIRK